MLLLMFSAELCPEQLAQTLGVEPKTVMKHLVYFRDSKLITVRTHKHTRYYGIRRQAPSQQAQLVELVIQMLAYDSAIRAAVAIVRSPLPEHTETTVEEEPSTPRSPSITP